MCVFLCGDYLCLKDFHKWWWHLRVVTAESQTVLARASWVTAQRPIVIWSQTQHHWEGEERPWQHANSRGLEEGGSTTMSHNDSMSPALSLWKLVSLWIVKPSRPNLACCRFESCSGSFPISLISLLKLHKEIQYKFPGNMVLSGLAICGENLSAVCGFYLISSEPNHSNHCMICN